MKELFDLLTPSQKAELARVSELMQREPALFKHGQVDADPA